MEIDTSKIAIVCISLIAAAAIIGGSIANMDSTVLVGLIGTCVSVIAALAGYNTGFRQGMKR
jgi:hypothetical protein